MALVLSGHAPDGSGLANRNFTGSVTSHATGEYADRVQIELRTSGGSGSLVWSTDFAVPSSQQTQYIYSVEPPGLLKSGITYGWRLRGHSSKYGTWTAWSGYLTFSVVRSIPVATIVSPTAGASYPTLDGVHFKVGYSDADGKPLGAFQIRVRPTTAPGSPAWDGIDNSWDVSPATTSAETAAKQVDRTYGGAALPAGGYSWQARVRDNIPGNWSDPVYGTFTLTADTAVSGGGSGGEAIPPAPAEDPTSVVDRRWGSEKARIVIRAHDASGFGPGTVVAIIYDAQNIGASEFYNSGGEFYFTLPATHPQVAVIEPWQVHYALEVHQGRGWVEKAAGLITDYNATENDAIFNGVDYLGLLNLTYDDRFNPTDTPNKSVENGGSKYVGWKIGDIIRDQLVKEHDRTHGLLGFITVPAIGAGLDSLDETITIFATFKQRLPFIGGLIESHRAGTGHKTRLSVAKQTDGSYVWHLAENPGLNRDAIRLEYGGMLTGFNIIPFGSFSTKVYGIGKRVEGSLFDYDVETAPNIDEAVYGSLPSVNLWNDTTDLADLQRRVKQRAMNVAKVGKAMALGIKVDALGLKNGWDITDSVPIVVKRGVVDTTNFGSGYWTVWGWQWEYHTDGETSLTLSILPREDTTAPDPDLIDSVPIHTSPEWQVGYGPPDTDTDSSHWYVDGSTGTVWEKDPADGSWTDTGGYIAPSGGAVVVQWQWAVPYGVSPVPSGKATLAVAPGSDGAAILWVNVTPAKGDGVGADLLALRAGDAIVLNDHAGWQRAARVTGPPVDHTTWVAVPVIVANGWGTLPVDGTALEITLRAQVWDVVPPLDPSAVNVTSEAVVGEDGHTHVRLLVEVVQPAGQYADLAGAYVQFTSEAGPDWTNQGSAFIANGHTTVAVPGVRGSTQYWVRAYNIDTSGNVSGVVNATPFPITTAVDNVAPADVTGFAASDGIEQFICTWSPVADADLSHYEVRYAVDDGSGTGPGGSPTWYSVLTKGTSVVVMQTVGKWWAQVRAVDLSGNASANWAPNLPGDAATVRLVDTVDVGEINGTKITDLSIETPKLKAGSITADKLEATLILASTIKTYPGTGKHVEMDPGGVRLYAADGHVLVNIPTDATSPVYVEGTVTAGHLDSAEATLSGQTDVALNATVILDASLPPPAAPVLTQGWDTVAIPNHLLPMGPDHGLQYDAAGGAGGATKVFYAIGPDGTVAVELLASDRSRNRTFTLPADGDHSINSVCRLGSYVYVLSSVYIVPPGDFEWRVYRFVQSTGAYDRYYQMGSDFTGIPAGGGMPVLTSDGTNLVLADVCSATGPGVFDANLKFQKYDGSMGAVGGLVDTGWTPGHACYVIAAGNFDFGAWRLAGGFEGSSTIYTFDSSGTEQTNEQFPVATNSPFTLTYGDALGDGARFWSAANSSLFLTKHTTWTWTTAPSLYWVGYAWYDSDATGGTHETPIGARASTTMGRRKWLKVDTATIPDHGGTNDPDKVRVYMLPNAVSDPGAGNFKRQVEDSLTTRTLTTYASGGAADGAGTAFPGGTAAELKSATTGWDFKGDGSYRLLAQGPALPTSGLVDGQLFYHTGSGCWYRYSSTMGGWTGDRIANGHFEYGAINGTVVDWTVVGTCNIVGSGKNGQRVDINASGGAYNSYIISTAFPVREGSNLMCTAWSKAVSGSGQVEYYAQFLDKDFTVIGSNLLLGVHATGGSTTWVFDSTSVTVPLGAVWARIIIFNGTNATTVAVDEVDVRTSAESSGWSFPGSPANGDLFYHANYRQWFAYHGTLGKWASADVYTFPFSMSDITLPASLAFSMRMMNPAVGYSLYIENIICWTYVAVTNSGSHYWKAKAVHITNQSATSATISSDPIFTTAADAANAFYEHDNGSVIGLGLAWPWLGAGAVAFELQWSKVGSPGGLYTSAMMQYRLYIP